jgi:hypothetical protein
MLSFYVFGLRLFGREANEGGGRSSKEATPFPPARGRRRLEKLFSERMYRHFMEDFGLSTANCAVP